MLPSACNVQCHSNTRSSISPQTGGLFGYKTYVRAVKAGAAQQVLGPVEAPRAR